MGTAPWTWRLGARFDDTGGDGRGAVYVLFLQPRINPVDFGDAPDSEPGTGEGNYHTLSTDSGPAHTVVPGLFMGARVDART